MITFSFNPTKSSTLPFIAASVRTLVVSWNDAADKKLSVARDAFVIPSNTLLPFAGFFPSAIAFSFASSNSYISINEAVNNLNNAIKGEVSHFNRTTLSNSLEQFIQNGGSQVISNGYNSVYNFINQVQRLGKIAYDQVGHIKVMPFITATIGKFMSSSKMNNQLENKKKEQKESAKQESEVSKEQESENFELKLDNSEAERDD